MPLITYIDDTEARLMAMAVQDKEVSDELARLRKRTGRNWLVRAVEYRTSFLGLFPWARRPDRFMLFAHILGPEFQIINFHSGGSGTSESLSTTVASKEMLMAFFMGCDVGADCMAKEAIKTIKLDEVPC